MLAAKSSEVSKRRDRRLLNINLEHSKDNLGLGSAGVAGPVGSPNCREGHLSGAFDDPDITTAGLALARTDRRSYTLADGILDRLVHNAHRIEMRGDSMRKNRGKPNA